MRPPSERKSRHQVEQPERQVDFRKPVRRSSYHAVWSRTDRRSSQKQPAKNRLEKRPGNGDVELLHRAGRLTVDAGKPSEYE